jgi:hypothetical protein
MAVGCLAPGTHLRAGALHVGPGRKLFASTRTKVSLVVFFNHGTIAKGSQGSAMVVTKADREKRAAAAAAADDDDDDDDDYDAAGDTDDDNDNDG